jgi:hypothetical protein
MTFAELLNGALAAIEREAPHYARQMAHALQHTSVNIAVDNDPVRLSAQGGAIFLERSSVESAVQIRTRQETIVAMVDGRCDLLDAITQGQVDALANPLEFEAIDVAVGSFLSAAVRNATVQRLWARYRRGIAAWEKAPNSQG